jgi:GDP-4-dehydro-6-deoxy-D-mannose reductase
MATIAVTGANGFVGRHLGRELVASGHTVIGVGHDPTAAEPDVVSDYVCADLTQGWPALPAVDAVAHLAGLAAVGPSFDEPARYVTQNSAMVIHLFEALRVLQQSPRVLIVSSGAVYDSQAEQPLDEQSPVAHTSPYVVSKVLVENLGSYYRRMGADVVIARPFNHIGPGQGPGFLVPDLVETVQQARTKGEAPTFGNLSTLRDYTDVRDVVRAYRLLLEASELPHEIYNVCSGRSLAGTDILDAVQSVLGDAGEGDADPLRVRPQDPSTITGSHDRITRDVGWQPVIDPTTSVGDYIAALDGPADGLADGTVESR